MHKDGKQSLFKGLLIVLLSSVIFLAALEGGARVFIHLMRGLSTAGMRERTLYLSYKPFVMFGPDWDELFARYKQREVKEKSQAYRILLIGGSTATYFPTAVLEDAFSHKFAGRKFEVINGAANSYNARQELIVTAFWGPSVKPDMIITLDGANDLTLRLKMKKAGEFYPNSTYELFLKKPMLAPIANIIMKSQLIQGIDRMLARIKVGPVNDYVDAIPVYISAQHSMNIIAKGLSAKRIMVLQPFNAFKDPLSEAEANFKHYRYREPVVKELYSLVYQQLTSLAVADNVLLVDGRFAFKGIGRTIFSDDVHFVNDEAYRILSEYILSFVTDEMMESESLKSKR